MSNLRIINNNISDASTLAASTTTSGFDVDNLKLAQKSSTWRSVGTAGTITSTFTSTTVNGVALAFTNLTSAATVTIELYLSAALQLTTGALSMDFAYDPPAGFTTNSSPSFGFGGGNYFSEFFADTTADEVRVIISDATNPDGLIEVSHLIIGDSFTPECNADYGAQVANSDNTAIKRTSSGDAIVNRGVVNKNISFSLNAMTPGDTQQVDEIAARNGLHTPVFISLMPDIGGESEQAYQGYGLLQRNMFNTAVSFNKFTSRMQIKEL